MLMNVAAFVCILIAAAATAAMWMLGKKSGGNSSENTDGSGKGNGGNTK